MALADYLREELSQRPLLVMAHTVVGYPSLDDNWRMLELMDEAGVDLVELQMPFSEPIADGPVFIRANQEALKNGLHRDDYFAFMRRAADTFDFRLLFMGYANTVFRMGEEGFCEKLSGAGGDGYIIADLPPEEALSLDGMARARGLDPIHLMTPVNSAKRLAEIAMDASGFVYCVARKGVTGRRTDLHAGIRDYLARCRAATNLPLALGFGIRAAEDIAAIKDAAEIAVVGTACLETWERLGEQGFRAFLRNITGAAA